MSIATEQCRNHNWGLKEVFLEKKIQLSIKHLKASIKSTMCDA